MESSQSILLNHLPGIYHYSGDLIELLNVFEETLFGQKPQDGEIDSVTGFSGLVPSISAASNLSNPFFTCTEFLSTEERQEILYWLSEWVAVSQPLLFDDDQLRKLIANAVPLYSRRGTRDYLLTMLSYLGIEKTDVTICDQGLPVFTVGKSELGKETRLGDPSFFFQVRVEASFSEKSAEEIRWFSHRVRSVIELAKPAHTRYELEITDNESSEGEITELSEIKPNPSNIGVSS